MFEFKWLDLRPSAKIGSASFLIGFVTTELLLVTSGMGWASALLPLLLFSGLMATGILFLTIGGGSKYLENP